MGQEHTKGGLGVCSLQIRHETKAISGIKPFASGSDEERGKYVHYFAACITKNTTGKFGPTQMEMQVDRLGSRVKY